MLPEIYFGEYYSVETTAGTEIIPCDVSGYVDYADQLRDYLEGKIYTSFALGQPLEGYLARLTMPGYLDSTPWGAYSSEEEALADLDEMYGIDS